MESENLKLLRNAHAAFGTGGDASFIDRTIPDVDWGTNGRFPGVAPVYRGHEGMRQWREDILIAWESFVVEAEEVIADDGDIVAVTEVLRGRGRGSGVDVESRQYALYEFREGQFARRRAFTSRDQLDEALASL